MKQWITPSYTFTPGGSGVGTIDLTGISAFDIKRLVAINNLTRDLVIYAPGANISKGYTALAGTLVTLEFNTTGMSGSDELAIVYDAADANDGLTDTQLRANPIDVSATNLDIRDLVFATDSVDVSGSSVGVSNFPASQVVSDGGGSLTVDGTVGISGSVAVTGPLTDVQLRATPVPVSGTVTANLGTIAGVATETTLASIDTKTSAIEGYSSYSPDDSNVTTGQSGLSTDGSGRLEVHAACNTDEGSFREDFPGAALTGALTGTLTFTNNSIDITGSGTLFTTELKAGQYIKKTADANSLFVQIDSIISDTSLTLSSVYAGTTAASTAVESNWLIDVSGTAASVTVSNSVLALLGSTATTTNTYVARQGDYGPHANVWKASVSQRIANQTVSIGLRDTITSPTQSAEFQFTGTTNTVVGCVSRSSSGASDITTTTVTIPRALTSATSLTYEINISNNQVTFSINGTVVATHVDHIPGSYSNLQLCAVINNTAGVTGTTLNLDWVLFFNVNQVEIANTFKNEPLPIRIQQFDDIVRKGVYYQTCGLINITAAADAATAGKAWLINPVDSTTTVRVRKVTFTSQLGSALAAVTSPRYSLERMTFTGTAAGASVTGSKRRSSDPTQVSSHRSATTGLTPAAGAVICEFLPTAAGTAVGYAAATVNAHEWQADDAIELLAGEGLVLRQADAGTAADTRRITFTFLIEEY